MEYNRVPLSTLGRQLGESQIYIDIDLSSTAYGYVMERRRGSDFRLRLISRGCTLIANGWYAVSAARHLYPITHHSIVRSQLDDPVIISGQKLATAAGSICLYWCIGMFTLTLTRKYGTGILGIGDCIAALLLLAAILQQSRFLPHSYSACDNAAQSQVSSDGSSLFAITAPRSTPPELQTWCKSWVLEWGVGIATICLYACSVTWNLVRGATAGKNDLHVACRGLKDFAWPFVCIIWILTTLFSRWSPHTLIRVYYLYLKRCFQQAHRRQNGNQSEFQLRSQCVAKPASIASYISATQTFESYLPFDIWLLVSQYLHQADIVSLAMTCRCWRNALGFDGGENGRVVEIFTSFTCWKSQKYNCWVCGIKVCPGCWSKAVDLETAAENHDSSCYATCGKCLRLSYMHCRHRGPRICPKVCKNVFSTAPCPGTTKLSLSEFPFRDQRTMLWTTRQQGPVRFACSNCARRNITDILAVRERRLVSVQKRLTEDPTHCHDCRAKLSKGPRFWRCKWCLRECRHDIHPPWSGHHERLVRIKSSEQTNKDGHMV